MNKLFYFLHIFLITSLNLALGQPIVTVDGNSYSNGQTAYLECGKTIIAVSVPPKSDGTNNYGMTISATANFYVTDGTTIIDKRLNLDPNRQDGYIDVGYQGTSSYTARIYIRQRPPTPSFTSSPTLCNSGNSATFSVSTNYSFQGTKPINIVWQTTGGISVNGGSTYTANGTTNSSVTVQYNSFGTVRAYAVIPGCNNIQSDIISKYVGTPGASDITFTRSSGSDPGSSLCSGSYYNFTSVPDLSSFNYNYNWSLPQGSSNASYFYSSGPNATIGAGSAGGGFILQMSVTPSGCSNAGTTSRTFFINNCGSFRVAQNPTTNQVTVLFDQEYDPEKLPDELQLSHEKNGVVKEKKVKGQYPKQSVKQGLSIDIDVHNLPKGTYYLKGVYSYNKPSDTESIRVILE